MGIISQEDIRGYNFRGIIVCTDCATANDEEYLKGDEIITEDHIEGDDFYRCDRCRVWLNCDANQRDRRNRPKRASPAPAREQYRGNQCRCIPG